MQPTVPEEAIPTRDTLTRPSKNYGQPLQPVWAAPPEHRHKRDHIPEVTRLQFRYFDGESWRLDWNDDVRIPKAIEIAFDLDPDAPAVRAKEFEEAHTAMQGGAALTQVLPPKDELLQEDLVDQDPLATLNTLIQPRSSPSIDLSSVWSRARKPTTAIDATAMRSMTLLTSAGKSNDE